MEGFVVLLQLKKSLEYMFLWTFINPSKLENGVMN